MLIDGGRSSTSKTEATFSCVDNGPIAKCVVAGYTPWDHPDHFEACVRMVRGDYCGDGGSIAADGAALDVLDDIGVDDRYLEGWSRDAEWTPRGAACVSPDRAASVDPFTGQRVADLLAACNVPVRADCAEQPTALLADRSSALP